MIRRLAYTRMTEQHERLRKGFIAVMRDSRMPPEECAAIAVVLIGQMYQCTHPFATPEEIGDAVRHDVMFSLANPVEGCAS